MRAPRLRILLLVVPLLVAACGDIFGPGSEQSQLETNRQRWRATGVTSYTFTVSTLCFCAVTGPVRVTVVNDSVVSATQTSNGQSVNPAWMPTIERLFDFIARGIDEHAVVLDVTYDASLGFPSKITYDGSFAIADEEITYTVSDVSPTGR